MASLVQRCKNAFQNSLRLLQHFIVPETQYAEACAGEIARTLEVLERTLRVLPTIKLNHQARSQTDEVHDVASNRNLASESVAAEVAVAYETPQVAFRIG